VFSHVLIIRLKTITALATKLISKKIAYIFVAHPILNKIGCKGEYAGVCNRRVSYGLKCADRDYRGSVKDAAWK
jgi:hypothetical protein